MSEGCRRSRDLIPWLAGELTDSAANEMRLHVASCGACKEHLPHSSPHALVAQIAQSEHLDSVKLSEYADGALDAVSRQVVESHLRWCSDCRARLKRLREGRLPTAPLLTGTIYLPPREPSKRLGAWWKDVAAVLAIAMVVVALWWFGGRGRLAGNHADNMVVLPPELLRELPSAKRLVMQDLCRNPARTAPFASATHDNRYRGSSPLSAAPPVEIVYPLACDVLPSRDLLVLVHTLGESPASVELIAKKTGTVVGRWSVPSGRKIKLPITLDYDQTYALVAHVEGDVGLRSEDRLFRIATEPLSAEVKRLSEHCRGNSFLLGALYEAYGMYGAADRYYAAAGSSRTRTTHNGDIYRAWRIRSGLDRKR